MQQPSQEHKSATIEDSQHSYTCHHLMHGVTMRDDNNKANSQHQDAANHPKFRCVTIKQGRDRGLTQVYAIYWQELCNNQPVWDN